MPLARYPRHAARALAASLCVCGLASCGGGDDDTLDAPRVEREIAADLEERTGTENVTVECPEDVERQEGDVFECELRAAGGIRARVRVTQRDDEGNLNWEVNP